MKKFLNFASVALVCLGLTACSSDDPQAPDDTRADDSIDYLDITFNGITYKDVPTKYDKNNDFVFLDSEFAPIYKAELANCQSLSIFLSGEKKLTLYTSLAENLKAMGLENMILTEPDWKFINESTQKSVATRAFWPLLGNLKLYDDRNYQDRLLDFTLQNGVDITIPNLGIDSYKFNDKCSSLILQNYIETNETELAWAYTQESPNALVEVAGHNVDMVFVGFENSNYGGRTITVVCAPAHTESRSTLPGFNDKLSSFKFFAAEVSLYSSNI